MKRHRNTTGLISLIHFNELGCASCWKGDIQLKIASPHQFHLTSLNPRWLCSQPKEEQPLPFDLTTCRPLPYTSLNGYVVHKGWCSPQSKRSKHLQYFGQWEFSHTPTIIWCVRIVNTVAPLHMLSATFSSDFTSGNTLNYKIIIFSLFAIQHITKATVCDND